MAGTAVDVATGENLIGQEVTPSSVAQNLLLPMSIRDIGQAIQSEGVPEGTALGLIGLFGAGLQSFKATEKQTASLLLAATVPNAYRKPGEAQDVYDKRKARHDKNVADAWAGLKNIGMDDPDRAAEILKADHKAHGKSIAMNDSNLNPTSLGSRIAILRNRLVPKEKAPSDQK